MQSQLVSELERLQQLHAFGFLSETELAQAKAKLLGAAPQDAMLARVNQAEKRAQLAMLQTKLAMLQTKLAQLETDWQALLSQALIRNKRGYRRPSRGWAVFICSSTGIMGIVTLLCGIFDPTAPIFFRILMLICSLAMTIGGVLGARYEWRESDKLNIVEAQYHQDRANCEAELNELKQWK
jgi:hypothetical protein